MGIYDRDYYQDDQAGNSLFGSIRGWSWSARLIGFYVALFFLDHLLPGDPTLPLSEWTYYNPSLAFGQLQLWRIFTYMFLDASPQSLLFSMVALFFFGPRIESALGRPKFLAFYILCGAGAALLGGVLVPIFYGQQLFLTGAWGPVMALIVATGVLFPMDQALFMFVLPLSMRNLAIISVVIDMAFAVSGYVPAVAWVLGSLTGYVLLKTPASLAWVDRLSGRGRSFPATVPFSKLSNAFTPKPVTEDELDRLLDKVHERGIDSLTAKEKATLKRAAKQRKNRSNPF